MDVSETLYLFSIGHNVDAIVNPLHVNPPPSPPLSQYIIPRARSSFIINNIQTKIEKQENINDHTRWATRLVLLLIANTATHVVSSQIYVW